MHLFPAELPVYAGMHDLFVHVLALLRECIKVDIQLGHQVNKGIYPAFCLKEFIDDDHFFVLQYAIPALKGSPFIPDHIPVLFGNAFDLV